jgi:hypothetical protein
MKASGIFLCLYLFLLPSLVLNNNKVGNSQHPFYAQKLPDLPPCEKIKLRTGGFTCSFRIGVVYNKVENSIAHARGMAGPPCSISVRGQRAQ